MCILLRWINIISENRLPRWFVKNENKGP
jgi:hypothetical protein